MASDALTTFLALATKTATFTTTALTLPKAGSPRRGRRVRALVGGVGGTSPTLTLKAQTSRDGGSTWLDRAFAINPLSATTDAINTEGEYTILFEDDVYANASGVAPQARVVGTITGTLPTFDVDLSLALSHPG